MLVELTQGCCDGDDDELDKLPQLPLKFVGCGLFALPDADCHQPIVGLVVAVVAVVVGGRRPHSHLSYAAAGAIGGDTGQLSRDGDKDDGDVVSLPRLLLLVDGYDILLLNCYCYSRQWQ